MIITIARQCGSGGHEIGKELASRLGLELYDRKKLEEEAKKLGKLDENKEFFQEKAVNSLLYSIAVSYGESNPMEKSFELIRELTQQKSAVIIGRCSGAIYANDPEATTVFLHADSGTVQCRVRRGILQSDPTRSERPEGPLRQSHPYLRPGKDRSCAWHSPHRSPAGPSHSPRRRTYP